MMMSILEYISQPWPWYIGGPAIAFIVFLLIWTGKKFGVSSSLESFCTIGGAGRIADYFKVDWKNRSWLLLFVLGSVIGGFLAQRIIPNLAAIDLNPRTIAELSNEGISFEGAYLPLEIFNWSNLFTAQGFIIFILGGLLVGFGTRWAGGCTSGHAITGLASLQLPSLVATIGFFIGGLISTHLFLPFILSL